MQPRRWFAGAVNESTRSLPLRWQIECMGRLNVRRPEARENLTVMPKNSPGLRAPSTSTAARISG
jgi:hypothetical protein